MRLNSSKHAQAPACANPLKNLPIALKSRPSEQLNTTHYKTQNSHTKVSINSCSGVRRCSNTNGSEKNKRTCFATALAKSLQVSVLPVPAGPSGAPPKFSFSAPSKVLRTVQHAQQQPGKPLNATFQVSQMLANDNFRKHGQLSPALSRHECPHAYTHTHARTHL